MTGRGVEASESAAAKLRGTVPPDDAGAETADRFDWQAAMAAADVLAAYLQAIEAHGDAPSPSGELICELHEDWALVLGPDAEIVSAKHKESSFGAFTTLRSLLGEGGVLHLYQRWAALGQTPSCRLVTTAGLDGPARQLVEILAELEQQDVTDGDVPAVVRSFHAVLSEALGGKSPPSIGSVLRFLATLRVDHGRPRRDQVGDFAPIGFARPVAEHHGRPEAAEAIWEAVLEVVRERMRAAGPRPLGALPRVLGARDEEGHERRTLTLSELQAIISVALQNIGAYRRLPRFAPTTRVAVKMDEGGCAGNAIERAEQLRLQFRRYWRGRTTAPGTMAERESVHNRLRQIADEEADLAREGNARWGSELWRRLDRRTSQFASDPRACGLDGDLLLGGVSELTNRCQIWFSERFDVDAALRAHKAKASHEI